MNAQANVSVGPRTPLLTPHSTRAVLATGQRVCSATHNLDGCAALFLSFFLFNWPASTRQHVRSMDSFTAKYNRIKSLGKGGFGRVYLVRRRSDSKVRRVRETARVQGSVYGTYNRLQQKADTRPTSACPCHVPGNTHCLANGRPHALSRHQLFAAKVTNPSTDPLIRAYTQQEVQLMGLLSHPNIVRFEEAFELPDQSWVIVMEYCEGGDLFGQLSRLCDAE